MCGRSHSEGPGSTETRAIARGARLAGCGWHPTLNGDLTPADVVPGSTARVWWRCSACQFEWPSPVYRRGRRGAGCRECSNVRGGILRATPKPGQSFADIYPDVAAEWHSTLNGDLKPTDLKPASNKKVWWQCDEGA